MPLILLERGKLITPVLADDKDKKCAKKTVTVGGIWEDWDDSLTPILCKNHQWWFAGYYTEPILCPTLPFSLNDGHAPTQVSLTSGVLRMSLDKYVLGSTGATIKWDESDGLDSPTLSSGKMIVKMHHFCGHGR